MDTRATPSGGRHDFDFLAGRWTVAHRRLKERLAGCREWETFGGTTELRHILQGQGVIDDNTLDLPGDPYAAATVRTFDVRTGLWSIWWIDSRHPGIGEPVHGRFEDGVGTFLGDDELGGRPIRVRFLWSDITPTSARWSQAFSADDGATWETNWVMDFSRVA
jgi:hypothetical protein